jgi:hypothetical protein
MAKPPKPPRAKKGALPTSAVTHRNLKQPDPNRLVDLNFKVPHELNRRMRQLALDQNLKVKDLLIRAFEDYERKHAGIYSELGDRQPPS